MRVVTATATVNVEHMLTMQLPEDIPAGSRSVVVVLEDGPGTQAAAVPLTFAPHPVGPAEPACTYRREEIYGDDGR